MSGRSWHICVLFVSWFETKAKEKERSHKQDSMRTKPWKVQLRVAERQKRDDGHLPYKEKDDRNSQTAL